MMGKGAKMYDEAAFVERAVRVAPSERQLAWQRMEFYAFIHFTVNTFTDKEWGDGTESPAVFDPSELDAEQWVASCKAAGMTGLILTCKHHDGFCLWPSAYTEHTVANSPWRSGEGDLVRETAEACRKAGLKFGVYVSPWDRHERSYGDSETYNRFFLNQLRELLTGYGELFCVWFDGACGEGPNGKRQVYDWDAYYALIRELQPGAVISVCGPDIRWCGNEAGHVRPSEWSVVPAHLQDNEKIGAKSQQTDDGTFASQINTDDEDLGSRDAAGDAEELIWYPAEVNTSIRPGWFYHASEDDQVKSLAELLHVYYGSVGGNACFLLNLPPDRRGLIHERDDARLRELGSTLKQVFAVNLASKAEPSASSTSEAKHAALRAIDGDAETYWRPGTEDEQASLTLTFASAVRFNRIVLREPIRHGQRIERFVVEYRMGDEWKTLYRGTVVGYQKIGLTDLVETDAVRLTIQQARSYPMLSALELYEAGTP